MKIYKKETFKFGKLQKIEFVCEGLGEEIKDSEPKEVATLLIVKGLKCTIENIKESKVIYSDKVYKISPLNDFEMNCFCEYLSM